MSKRYRAHRWREKRTAIDPNSGKSRKRASHQTRTLDPRLDFPKGSPRTFKRRLWGQFLEGLETLSFTGRSFADATASATSSFLQMAEVFDKIRAMPIFHITSEPDRQGVKFVNHIYLYGKDRVQEARDYSERYPWSYDWFIAWLRTRDYLRNRYGRDKVDEAEKAIGARLDLLEHHLWVLWGTPPVRIKVEVRPKDDDHYGPSPMEKYYRGWWETQTPEGQARVWPELLPDGTNPPEVLALPMRSEFKRQFEAECRAFPRTESDDWIYIRRPPYSAWVWPISVISIQVTP